MPTDSGGTPSHGWQIVEDPSFELAVSQCGSHEFFDEALAPVIWGMHRNPKGFDQVPGFPGIYIARTKIRLIGLEIIPSYRLWFRIVDETRTVHKLWVELAPPEDIGLTDNLWDDDPNF